MPQKRILLKLKQPLPLPGPGAPGRPAPIPRIRLVYRPAPPPEASLTPVRLALLHALFSFAALAGLPRHPLSIPTALGLAAAVVFYIQFLALRIKKETP